MKTRDHIFFIHVQKSAGLSITGMFAQEFGAEQVLHAPHPRLVQGTIEWAVKNYRVVAGHFHLHHLPSQIFETTYVFTILRDPVDRVLSQYHFFRQEGSATGPEVDRAKRHDLHSIVREFRAPQVFSPWSNWQTLIFSGANPGVTPTRELLERAKRNLERLDFVGVYEQLGDAVQRLAADLSWSSDVQVPVVNVTARRRLRSEVDEEELAAIEQANNLDIELYEHAVALSGTARPRLASDTKMEIDVLAQTPGLRRERGTNEVRITDAYFAGERRQLVVQGTLATFVVELRSEIDCDDITVGIMISDQFGAQVYGTNTSLLGERMTARAGESLAVRFEFEMNLAPNAYHLTVAAHTSSDDTERCFHWIDNCSWFMCEARGKLRFAGVVDLKARALR